MKETNCETQSSDGSMRPWQSFRRAALCFRSGRFPARWRMAGSGGKVTVRCLAAPLRSGW